MEFLQANNEKPKSFYEQYLSHHETLAKEAAVRPTIVLFCVCGGWDSWEGFIDISERKGTAVRGGRPLCVRVL